MATASGGVRDVLRRLLERRRSQHGAAYVLWLLVYLLAAALVITQGKGSQPLENPWLISLLLLPAGIVNVQLLRPTLLGWWIILALAVCLVTLQLWLVYPGYAESGFSPGGSVKNDGRLLLLLFAWIAVPFGCVVAAKPGIPLRLPAA